MSTKNNITKQIYSWFSQDKIQSCVKQLSENQILNLANDINGLFSETNLIESKPDISLPQLVVVGTQSSGKSSVLNSIINMDILPTGKNMVTRTPLDIRLHKTQESYVSFDDKIDDVIVEKRIPIKQPIPLESEINEIRQYIEKKTIEVAGNEMNISYTPIIINVYSPNVPNLSLIDLPGLTMVACTDKGQPIDISSRIENLVTSYIKQKKTIVLAIMQARSDLETDIGLALIKKCSTEGQRIVGVLTKPDLMNTETHVGEYLTNNISKNLMLTYGYYVIKNRNGQEMKEVDILKGFELEKQYFINHNEYKKPIYTDRIGSHNLTKNLNNILVSSIVEILPTVMTEISGLENIVINKLDKIGSDLPQTKEGKLSFMNRYISNFYQKFIEAIESRGSNINTGKQLKDTFITYRTDINSINPFLNKLYTKEYFDNIISGFEGNHMTFQVPPIQILESVYSDSRINPIMSLQDKSMKCIDDVIDSIITLLRHIGMMEEFALYPSFANHIMTMLVDDILSVSKDKTKQYVHNVLRNEIDYIWTDDHQFKDEHNNFSKVQKPDVNAIKKFLFQYFITVTKNVGHNVPKIIMTHIVKEIQKVMLGHLLQYAVTDEKLHLLKQDDEIEKQRIYYNNLKTRLISIKKSFSQVSS